MSTDTPQQSETLRLILVAENSRKRFRLEGEMLVGRDASCAIVLQSLHISRHHSKIVVTEHDASIEDLDSANGTFVNGLRVSGRVPLHLGDLVCFDDHGFRITADAVPEASLGRVRAITAEQVVISPQLIHQRSSNSTQNDVASSTEDTTEPSAVEKISADTTRALTFHEMKEILRQSQATQEQDNLLEPRLVIQTAPLDGKIIQLQALEMDTRWKLGNDLTSKICLREKSILVDHAYLSRNPSGYRLTATSAAKSYKLNGQSVRDGYLMDGDSVQLGKVVAIFKTTPTAPDSTSENPAPPTPSSVNQIPWAALFTAAFLLAVIVAVFVLQH